MKKYIDRGSSIKGVDRTFRDSRIPFAHPRAIENANLLDGRLRRRTGYNEVHAPHVSQAICKSTGVQYNKRHGELFVSGAKGTSAVTPLSYAVIKHQSDFQLKRANSATIEFMVRLGNHEELVRQPYQRVGDATYQLRKAGVYILDQSILSNEHAYETGSIGNGVVTPVLNTVITTASSFVHPLTTMAFGYNLTELFFIFGMVEKSGGGAGKYWPKNVTMQYSFPGGSYTPGDVYHVCLVHDITLGANGRLILYINGTSVQTLDLPSTALYGFIGEYDVINGITYASGQKRDIVILNEFTARGNYASACKLTNDKAGFATYHTETFPIDTGYPYWCMSPPQGTAMWDLRIWTEARSSANISLTKGTRILPTDAGISNLKGNWHLNDGGPICGNFVTGLEKRLCTLHHGYPGYLNESAFINGIGLKFGEGQHLTFTSLATDRALGSGLAAKLFYTFRPDRTSSGALEHQDRHSHTVQIQITVPDAFQPEINDKNDGVGLIMRDVALVETRRGMGLNTTKRKYALKDGEVDDGVTSRNAIGHPTEGVAPYETVQYNRAFDQTLWSIEGKHAKNSEINVNNEPDKRRIPLARGLLTPSGHIVYELYKFRTGFTKACLLRLRSTNPLTVGNVYTITFIQRALYPTAFNADTWRMEIWVENITAQTPATLDTIFTVGTEAGSDIHTVPIIHSPDYDINIGASYVNDYFDWSIKPPDPQALANVPYGTTFIAPGNANNRDISGPWPVTQRFMSPYQDQPGSFAMGFFRLWSIALPTGNIAEYGNSSIGTKDYSNDLLVNLEFSEVTANKIPSKCRFPEVFNMGYKSWGMPQGYKDTVSQPTGTGARVYDESYEGGWAMEDCLGYQYIESATTPQAYKARQVNTVVNGIMPFKSVVAQQFGVLSVYDDSLAFDNEVTNDFKPLYLVNGGLLCEFSSGSKWQGTVVGDRTIMTSFGGLTKVFNGRTCTIAGFKRWSGGLPYINQAFDAAGGLTVGYWYGVTVVYYSEQYNIYQAMPVQAIRLSVTNNTIQILATSAHPDPRISVVEVYRTLAQPTEELALAAPLYKTRLTTNNMNAVSERITIYEADVDLAPVILDRNVTEFPVCAYSATLNGRLYLAGDILSPDSVYFSDAGNPERIDIVANVLTIEEGSGDAPTGLVAAFGSVFLFKPNALWRIDDIGGNRHQQVRLSGIGAVSPTSIQVITDPDSGRTSIFFWSQHGPYIFDGSTIQYVGQPIEEQVLQDVPSRQYHWLDASTVVAAHSSNDREIICIYSPTIADLKFNKNLEAVVYNYRFNSWYKYTGMQGTVALSLSFTGDTRLSVAQEDDKSTTVKQKVVYRLYLGGSNGRLYSWNENILDGLPDGMVLTNPYTVTLRSTNVFTISSATPGNFDLSGLWITFVSQTTGEWLIAPIISNTGSTITVNADWINAYWLSNPYVPGTGNLVYLVNPTMFVEFPWDELEMPFVDKQVIDLITWHLKDIKYKTAINYDLATSDSSWSDLSAGTSDRKRTRLNKRCEALKLKIKSHTLAAAFDAAAFYVHHAQEGNTP